MRPTWAEINLRSVKKNLEKVKSLVEYPVSIMAVVKANAYGHGAISVSKKLVESGIDSLAVTTLEEGLELRESGIKLPIIVLGGIQKDEIPCIIKNGLTPTVYDIEILKTLSRETKKINKKLDFHLKIDTGMGRLGIKSRDIESFANEYKKNKCLNLKGVFTHLASADNTSSDFTYNQISIFYRSLKLFKSLNVNPLYFHLANSAAIQNYPRSHGNLVRPGIMLYGAGEQNGNSLYPVMKLKSRIIQLKWHEKGSPISYGGHYVTDRRSLIATVPIGYADGYIRRLSDKAFVSVKGEKAKVVGTICMDFIMIDVTDYKDIRTGDEVTLFGDKLITINDISNWAETIPYEIMTLVGKRVRKVYYDD